MATIIVTSNLQAALNAANPGDILVLTAGVTFTAPVDGFVLPVNANPALPITLQSSRLGELPVNTQVTIADGPKMPRLLTTGSWSALVSASGTNGWSLQGLEITSDASQYCSLLVNLGSYTALPPQNITFDRCWIHSQEDGTNNLHNTVKICVTAEGINLQFLSCRIATPSVFIGTSSTFDNTAAILLINGPGPLTIRNCFINAWFTPYFMGGGDLTTNNTATISPGATLNQATFSAVPNLAIGDLVALAIGPATEGQPGLYYQVAKVTGIAGNVVNYIPWAGTIGSRPGCTGDCGIPLTSPPVSPGGARWNGSNPGNITITQNTFWINPTISQQIYDGAGTLYLGAPRVPKGFFEMKACDTGYFAGNRFIGWPATFAMTQHNQTGPHGGPSPWSVIKDVTIENNLFDPDRSFGSQLVGLLLEDNVGTSVIGGNVTFQNNLFTTGGWVGDLFSGHDVTFRHNTIINNVGWANGKLLTCNYVPITNFTFKDNIVFNNEYGMQFNEGGTFVLTDVIGNVLVTEVFSPFRPNCSNFYPPTNSCPASIAAVGFVDAAAKNYRLAPTSPYKNTASDGTDPGVDMDALNAALGGTLPTQYTLTVVGGTGSGTYFAGTNVSISAIVPVGQQFVNWTGNVTNPGNPNSSVVVNSNQTVTANFQSSGSESLCDPSLISSLAIWYKLNAVVGLSNGAAITNQLADSSSGGHTPVGVGVTYQTNVTNNLSAALFSGSAQYFDFAAHAWTPGTNWTLIAIVKLSGSSGYRSILGGSSGALQWRIDNTTNKQTVNKAAIAAMGTSTTGVSSSATAMLAVTYDGSTLTFYLNGTVDGTASSSQTFSSANDLFGNSTGGELFAGYKHEFYGYTKVLSATEMGNMNDYVASKYALTIANRVACGTPPAQYTLTVDGGTGSGTYDTGTVVAVSATVPLGKHFVNWTGPVADFLAANTTVTLTADSTVTAVFADDPLSFTLTVTGGTGSGLYIQGTIVNITVTVPSHKRFVNWIGDVTDSLSPTTTVTVISNMVVSAVFEELPFNLPTVVGGRRGRGRGRGMFLTM